MRCLLVDKIVTLHSAQRISAVKNVTMSEPFLRDHFPRFPVMPGMLQLEAAAQAASWLIYASTGRAFQARLQTVAEITFKGFVIPGDQMRIDCELLDLAPERAIVKAQIFVGDTIKTVIKGMALRPVAIEELADPREAGRYFDFISGAAPMGGYAQTAGRKL